MLNSTRIDQPGAEQRNNFCSEAAREQALALCREHEASLQGLRAQLELTRDRSSSLELQALGEQLAAAESAIKARCRERDALETARTELQAQLTELVGHKNHKQKIQHTMRIKLENDELRNERKQFADELAAVRLELEKAQSRAEVAAAAAAAARGAPAQAHPTTTRPAPLAPAVAPSVAPSAPSRVVVRDAKGGLREADKENARSQAALSLG